MHSLVTVLTSTRAAGGTMRVVRPIWTGSGTAEGSIAASSRTGSSGPTTGEATIPSNLFASWYDRSTKNWPAMNDWKTTTWKLLLPIFNTFTARILRGRRKSVTCLLQWWIWLLKTETEGRTHKVIAFQDSRILFILRTIAIKGKNQFQDILLSS